MADNISIRKINETTVLVENNRVFLPSSSINIFPCSRRGQYSDIGSVEFYDPEARLNTERTNRIGTAINGFTDSFIVSEKFTDNSTLVFVLAGYRLEVKNFVPSDIAAALGITDGNIYAHLSLHEGISLNALAINGIEGYFTEILYRQSTADTQKNYLDVAYSDSDNGLTDDFFVGISFTKELAEDTLTGAALKAHNLPLFKISSSSWELVQTSLLPKIEHGATSDSVIIEGATTVNNTITAEKLVITDKAPDGIEKGEIITHQVRVNRITSNDGSITVDNKKLIVNKSLEMLAKESATEPAIATIEKVVIGDLTVKTDAKLKNSTGKITAKEIAAEKITQNGNAVPAIKLIAINDTLSQLQITTDASKK